MHIAHGIIIFILLNKWNNYLRAVFRGDVSLGICIYRTIGLTEDLFIFNWPQLLKVLL